MNRSYPPANRGTRAARNDFSKTTPADKLERAPKPSLSNSTGKPSTPGTNPTPSPAPAQSPSPKPEHREKGNDLSRSDGSRAAASPKARTRKEK